jgi:hypothetical protein
MHLIAVSNYQRKAFIKSWSNVNEGVISLKIMVNQLFNHFQVKSLKKLFKVHLLSFTNIFTSNSITCKCLKFDLVSSRYQLAIS